MTRHCSLIVMASATLLLTAAFIPAQAAEVSDAAGGVGSAVGGAAGGVTGAVGGTVNGVTGPVTGTVNGVTGDNAQTTASVGSNGELSLQTRSQMANGINAKAQALSPNRLAQLCVSAGGDEGCGSGDRSQILGIIDNRLEVIGDEQLASLCLSTGANGCGGGSSGAGNANPIAEIPGAADPAMMAAAGCHRSPQICPIVRLSSTRSGASRFCAIRRPTKMTSFRSASSSSRAGVADLT
jgi:hypothetical protein